MATCCYTPEPVAWRAMPQGEHSWAIFTDCRSCGATRRESPYHPSEDAALAHMHELLAADERRRRVRK